MESRKLRVLVVGTNKLFKQELVTSLLREKMYAYNVIDRQSEFFVFRQSATGKESVSQISLEAGRNDWTLLNDKLPLANSKLVSSYFTYFYTNKKQRELQAVSRAGKEAGTQYRPTQTYFLIDANFTLKVEPDVLDALEVIDLPQLYEHKNQSEMYFGAESASTIHPDMVVIAIDEREYFAENSSNIKRALFANPHDANFGSVQKMWVVKRSSEAPIDRECIGTLFNELDMFVEWRSKDQFHDVMEKELPRLFDQKYRGEGEPEEEDVLRRNIIDDQPPPMAEVPSNQIKPLMLTKQQLKTLPSAALQESQQLLQVDPEHFPIDAYNKHLERLGYNKRIVPQSIHYTREICMFLLLGLLTVWTGTPYLLLFVVLVALAAIERTRQTHAQNKKHFHEEKKRYMVQLYGKDGVLTQRKKEIKEQLQRRRLQ